MGANDGAVLGFSQLVNNGPDNLRFNLVLVSEGYREEELPLFHAQCDSFVRALFWAAPFSDTWSALNIFRLDVRSTDSGMDDPAMCSDGSSGSGAQPDTYFDSTNCSGGVRRALDLDSGAVMRTVRGYQAAWKCIIVLVNSSLYGGTNGSVAVFSTPSGWENTAIHEFGHNLGLADEYECYVCNGSDSGRTWGVGGFGSIWNEPGEANITSTNSRTGLKWVHLVSSSTPCPTTPGSVPAGTVGLFEGAGYYQFALFRPEQNCRMRSQSNPFCGVCREEIQRVLSAFRPMTPSLVLPSPVPASVTASARVREKVLAGGKGAYNVTLDVTTNLQGTVAVTYQLDNGTETDLPAPPSIAVPVNLGAPDPYSHTAEVRASIGVADLDYWVPEEAQYMSAQATVPIGLPRPSPSGNSVRPQYDAAESVSADEQVTVSLRPEIPEIRAGNGFLYVAQRTFYTRVAMKLTLDRGYFGPDDDPSWKLLDIVWTPQPSSASNEIAVYDVSYDAGLCWLGDDRAGSVPPERGFQIVAEGHDAIGQAFSATGQLYPSNEVFQRSISTVEIPSIPEWEWPVEFVKTVANPVTVVEGVNVQLDQNALRIGGVEVPLLLH
jgi:hypothetical protein